MRRDSVGLMLTLGAVLGACTNSQEPGAGPGKVEAAALSTCAPTALSAGLYRVLARSSGKALEVTGIQLQNGARVTQYSYLAQGNQQWQLSATSGGFSKLIANHSGRALDVSEISQNNGAALHQWDYLGGDNQQWCLGDVGGGYYKLVAKHSGKAAEVAGNSLDNGAAVRQNAYVGAANQQWTFELIGAPPPPSTSLIKVGSSYTFQVATPGFTNRYLRRSAGLAVTDTVSASSSDALKLEANWKAVAGLADANCFSFESASGAGQYLRHALSRVRADANDNSLLFKNDATFCAQAGLDGASSTVSLASKNFPGSFIRHRNAEVWLDASDTGNVYKQDASWTPQPAWTVGVNPPPPPPPPPPNGRGATVPWTEYQAENGQTNAQIIGPSRQKWDAGHIEAEAIGRKAVRLNATGDYVTFTSTAAFNSLVVRVSIPDAPGGGGIDATLGLYVGGVRVKSLPLTSRYAWSYRGGLIGDPIVELPASEPHTFFDETRILLSNYPAGTSVTLKRDAQDSAAFYVVDLIDLEQAPPPLSMPAGFRNVSEFGILPDDGKDHADDLLRAMSSGGKLWFPAGNYRLEKLSGGNVGLDNPGAELRGAGIWYTNLRGPKAMFFCAGASTRCVFGDFSMFGEAKARAEETQGVQKGFAGPMGANSLIENVWLEHYVGAIWVGNDPPYQSAPTERLTVRNCRIRNTYADGINLDNGTSNSLVENCHFRNVGDDAAVVWSIKWSDWVRERTFQFGPNFINPAAVGAPDQGQAHGNVFRKLSVQMPWRANCFAAYGGQDNLFENSTCEDVLTYPGILIDNEFSPYPFGPLPTTFRDITLTRAGGPMFLENTANPWQHGALKLYLREGDVNDIVVENLDIIDPTYAGIEFRGFGSAFVPPGERFEPGMLRDADNAVFRNVKLRNIRITGAGSYGIEVTDGGGKGSVNFEGVSVSGSARGALSQGAAPSSFFIRGAGNSGW